MRITITVPDNTVRITYSLADEAGYESEPKPVTMGMIGKVEADDTEHH